MLVLHRYLIRVIISAMLSVKPQKTQLQDSEQIHESGLVLPDTADDALRYLKDHGGESNFVADDVRMRKLKRKIDFIVIPFLALPFLANYLDKVLFNVGQSLHFVQHEIHNSSTPTSWESLRTLSWLAISIRMQRQHSGSPSW